MAPNFKRKMKNLALDGARISTSMGGSAVTRRVLRRIGIGYEASPSGLLYPGGAKAAACISVDFDVTQPDRYGPNRSGTEKLLELSEKYGIPLTWAICGKTAVEDRENYHRILDSQVKQEIAIHTYSHMDALECKPKEFEVDIRKCLDVVDMKSAPKTFIFPYNRENHFEVIRRLGFKTYRGKTRVVGPPARNNGLWNDRPVYYVDQKSYGAQSLMVKYADLCASSSALFHLWTHPWSIVIEGDANRMFRTLDPVFAHLDKMKRQGDMALCTMGELADHFGSAAEAEAAVVPETGEKASS